MKHSLPSFCYSLFTTYCLLFTTLSYAADPAISNLTASQRSGTELVDINFTLTDDDGDSAGIQITAFDTSGETDIQIPINSVSTASFDVFAAGNFALFTATPGDHHIVWDVGRDWDNQFSDAVRIDVTADASFRGLYTILDLTDNSTTTADSIPDLLTNIDYKTTKIVFRGIWPGTFTMGSPDSESGRGADEPQHQVTISDPFYMSVFETTQKQWELVTGNNPSYTGIDGFIGDTDPVEQVTWYDVRGGIWPGGDPASASFLGILRTLTGLDLDLPTEAQWEYACRAGTTRSFNNNSDSDIFGLAWYYLNSGWSGTSTKQPHTVGTRAPNNWGLYDMHGNVGEWCLDWYGDYGEDEIDPEGVAAGGHRIFRGGYYVHSEPSLRSAYRAKDVPSSASPGIGVRLLLRVN